MQTVTIGITGHRTLGAPDCVAQGMDQAIARVQAARPGAKLVALSPLAPGADRLFARRLLALEGASLVVLLPMAEAEYLAGESKTSRAEFAALLALARQVVSLPPSASRLAAYRLAGEYVLAHSDVLIAAWDGKPPRGEGGTGEVVRLARQRGMPLAWVLTERKAPGKGTPAAQRAEVQFENFGSLPGGA